MIRVLICDDQHVVCEGLRTILGTSPRIEVVGLAHNGAEALDLTATARPDVVLMDLKMPVVDGVQATREIRARFPGVRVLVLTTYDADEWVFDAIRAGASGYLLKDSPREALVAAVEGTAAGKQRRDRRTSARRGRDCAQSRERSPEQARSCRSNPGGAAGASLRPRGRGRELTGILRGGESSRRSSRRPALSPVVKSQPP